MNEIRQHIIERSNRNPKIKKNEIKKLFRKLKPKTKKLLKVIADNLYVGVWGIVIIFWTIVTILNLKNLSSYSRDYSKYYSKYYSKPADSLREVYKTRNNVSQIPPHIENKFKRLDRFLENLEHSKRTNRNPNEINTLQDVINRLAKELNVD